MPKTIKLTIFLFTFIISFFAVAHSASAVYPAPHHFRRRFILLAGAIAKRLRLGENLFVKFFQKMVPGPVAGRRKFLLSGLLFTFFIFFAGLVFTSPAYGASVFYSVGQDNTANLMTGTPDITSIVSGVATFSVVQTGNIGAGDDLMV